ncbi:signal-regulatory protein beta-1-like [Molossus nigricans]
MLKINKSYCPNSSYRFPSTCCVRVMVRRDFIHMKVPPVSEPLLHTWLCSGWSLAAGGAKVCSPLCDLCPMSSELLPCAVSVPPTLEVTQHTVSGNQENVTCLVKNFYPQHLQLTWLENGNKSRTETASTRVENPDGTFSWSSWLLVNLSAHREDVMLTWLVEHDGQPAVSTNLTVKASAHQRDQSTDGPSGPGTSAIIFVTFLLGLKVLLLTGFTVTHICRWWSL